LPLSAPRIFDQQHYALLNQARGDVAARLLNELKGPLDLRSAVDVGCGLGHFSGLLQSLGFDVIGVDGRLENVEEAALRNSKVPFRTANVEDPGVCSLGTFDLTLCFGLLYHLENPLLAIRHLHALTKSLLLAESVIHQGDEPSMVLLDEAVSDDQGLEHIAFYPTETCLIKMLYRAGFTHVYRFVEQPGHSDFTATREMRRVRTMLAASQQPINSTMLVAADDVRVNMQPWNARSEVPRGSAGPRLKSFAQRPLSEKIRLIKRIIGAR
jgi:2-polyprenyl-3-methyl-5-hydroxy-6-metoxy-1,4-benzoquinol methylase